MKFIGYIFLILSICSCSNRKEPDIQQTSALNRKKIESELNFFNQNPTPSLEQTLLVIQQMSLEKSIASLASMRLLECAKNYQFTDIIKTACILGIGTLPLEEISQSQQIKVVDIFFELYTKENERTKAAIIAVITKQSRISEKMKSYPQWQNTIMNDLSDSRMKAIFFATIWKNNSLTQESYIANHLDWYEKIIHENSSNPLEIDLAFSVLAAFSLKKFHNSLRIFCSIHPPPIMQQRCWRTIGVLLSAGFNREMLRAQLAYENGNWLSPTLNKEWASFAKFFPKYAQIIKKDHL